MPIDSKRKKGIMLIISEGAYNQCDIAILVMELALNV